MLPKDRRCGHLRATQLNKVHALFRTSNHKASQQSGPATLFVTIVIRIGAKNVLTIGVSRRIADNLKSAAACLPRGVLSTAAA